MKYDATGLVRWSNYTRSNISTQVTITISEGHEVGRLRPLAPPAVEDIHLFEERFR
jgi:hypothetical protein